MPVVEYIYPPAPLLTKCEEPAPQKITKGADVVDSLLNWKLAFGKCASKVDNTRNWVEMSKTTDK